MVPELGKDPLEEFKEILNDPLKHLDDDKDEKDEKEKIKEDGPESGSQMLMSMEKQRREMIEQKYQKRVQEE